MKQIKMVEIYCAHCKSKKPNIEQCITCGSWDNNIQAVPLPNKFDGRKAFQHDNRLAQPQ